MKNVAKNEIVLQDPYSNALWGEGGRVDLHKCLRTSCGRPLGTFIKLCFSRCSKACERKKISLKWFFYLFLQKPALSEVEGQAVLREIPKKISA